MIWVIDDDAYMLKLLGYKIQKLGHEVSLFHSAEEVLIAELNPGLTHIFTDIHLDGKSGFELAEIFREKNSETIMVALTSSDLTGDVQAEELFHHIFQKPLTDDDLDSVLKEEFDFPYLNAMIESEEDKIDIIRHFHEETTRDSNDLRDAIVHCDNDKTLLLSHRLAGRLAQFSQEKISAGFRAAEQKLLDGICEDSEIIEVIEQLEVFLKRLARV